MASEIEAVGSGEEARQVGERHTVFPTAQLVWLDEESGEVLEVEVTGQGASEWIEGLVAQGFVVCEPTEERGLGQWCRIEVPGARG